MPYDVRQPWSNPNAGRTEQFLIALGALPRPLRLADLGIGRALSTHFELVASADTDIVSARINVEQYDTATDSLEKLDKPADKLSRSRDQFHLPLRAGSEIVDESSEANRMRRERQLRGRTDLGSVFVTLLPRPSVVLAPISISALQPRADRIRLLARDARWSNQCGDPAAGTSVGWSVFVPGAEHPYTTRALLGVRVLAALSALCGFLVALMIAGQTFTGGRSPSETVTPLPRTDPLKGGSLSGQGPNCRILSGRINLSAGDMQVVPRAVQCGPFVSGSPVSYEVRESERPKVRPLWQGAEIFLTVLSGISAAMFDLAWGLAMLVR